MNLVTGPPYCPLHIAGEDCPVCFEAWRLGLPGLGFMQTLGVLSPSGLSMEPSVQLVRC